MSRALGVLTKLAFFGLVVVVGLVLFSRDLRGRLSDRWAMRACAGRVQADIDAVMPWVEPKVDHCEGIPTRATCLVETDTRKGRKTAPVKDWDCSHWHISEHDRREWMQETLPNSAAAAAQDREIETWTAQVKDQFTRGLRYVVEKMSERQQAIGEPDLYPRVVGSSTE